MSKILLIIILTTTIFTRTICSNLRSQWSTQTLRQIVKDDDTGASFVGFVIGPIMFIMSFALIWFNEKRAAINKKRLIKINQLLDQTKNSSKTLVSNQNLGQNLIPPTSSSSNNPINLIHLTGPITIPKPAQDPISKLSIQNCLRLDRNVQVMQYRTVSNKKNQPPQLGWYSYHYATASNYQNDQARWFIKSQVFVAGEAVIQGFRMNQKEMKVIPTNGKYTPNEDIARAIAQATNRPTASFIIQGDYIYFPATDLNKQSHGTLRLTFTTYKPTILSIIASHTPDHTLQPFRIDLHENQGKPDTLCCQNQACCCACNALGEVMKPISQIDFVVEGKKNQQEIIKEKIMTDKIVTNILRVVAYFLMVLGIYVFLSPIVELLGYIPLVGGFLKATTGALIFLAALIVCIPLFLVTFSLAWLVYHPKTGILVLLLAGVIVGIIVVLDNVYGGGV